MKSKKNKKKWEGHPAPPQGKEWVMTGVLQVAGNRHATGGYYPIEDIVKCPWCENHKNALKITGLCYPCWLRKTAPRISNIPFRDFTSEGDAIANWRRKHDNEEYEY